MYYRLVRKLFQGAGKRMCLECQDFIKEGSKILDLGCGSGVIGKEFQKFFRADLIGIDIKDRRVEEIPFQIFDGFHIPFSENSFDTVLINYVLHHAKDPKMLLKEAGRVSRGNIIIYEDLPEGFLSNLFCKLHGITFNYFFQKTDKRCDFRKSEDWKKIFENLGLKLIFEKIVSSNFNPVKKKLFVLEKV